MTASLSNRSFSAGKFMFALDGTPCGYVNSFEGGNMAAEVSEQKQGALGFQKKTVTTRKWSPIKVRTGIGMSRGLFNWMDQAFVPNFLYKNGSLTVCNANYEAQRRVDLMNMLITKVTFPALDGAGKDLGYFDVEMTPEMCRWAKEGGQKMMGEAAAKQKAWQVKHFALEFPGLPTRNVSKVSSISWEAKVIHDTNGGDLEHTVLPTYTTISDFNFDLSMIDMEPWAQKAHAWFIDGKCLEEDEMTAAIILQDPARKEIGRITLFNVGLKAFDANPKLEGDSGQAARFKVTCYAERCKLELKYNDA